MKVFETENVIEIISDDSSIKTIFLKVSAMSLLYRAKDVISELKEEIEDNSLVIKSGCLEAIIQKSKDDKWLYICKDEKNSLIIQDYDFTKVISYALLYLQDPLEYALIPEEEKK